MGDSSDSKSRMKPIAVTVLGILASAYIGGLVKSYLDRAKPSVELAYVDFAGTAPATAKIRASPGLAKAYDNIPFKFPAFKDAMTLEDFDNISASCADSLANLKESIPALLKVREILRSRASDYPRDKLRLELLNEWTRPPGNALDVVMNMVMAKHQIYSSLIHDEKYQKYRAHPPEWRDPGTARVALSGTKSFDLGEEITRETDDQDTRADKLETNLQRRLWIYLDLDPLLQILNYEEQELQGIMQSTSEFLDLMKDHRSVFDPERLHAVVVISNFGSLPAIFRSIGVIALKTSRAVVPIEAHARLSDKPSVDSAFVVKGGESLTVDFFSKDTIQEISEHHFNQVKQAASKASSEGSNALQALYDTEVIDANVVLYRMTGNRSSAVVKGSRKVVFGQSANTEASDQLVKAAKDISW